MLRKVHRTGPLILAGFGACALFAAPALATPQFTPTATALMHTIEANFAGGTTWTTGGLSVNGQIAYSDVSQQLSIGAKIDVLNYFDPSNGSCPSDAASNCAFNFAPDLDLDVIANYVGIAGIVNNGDGTLTIQIDFQTTGGWDILWTDPSDGNSVQLRAQFQAGSFNGFPTSGLSVTATYDTVSQSITQDPTAIAFAVVDQTTPLASMFNSGGSGPYIELDVSNLILADFVPSIDSIAQSLIDTGTLPSFTGEGQGQIFRVSEGSFVVPEPSAALLLAAGLIGLAGSRRRGRRVRADP